MVWRRWEDEGRKIWWEALLKPRSPLNSDFWSRSHHAVHGYLGNNGEPRGTYPSSANARVIVTKETKNMRGDSFLSIAMWASRFRDASAARRTTARRTFACSPEQVSHGRDGRRGEKSFDCWRRIFWQHVVCSIKNIYDYFRLSCFYD